MKLSFTTLLFFLFASSLFSQSKVIDSLIHLYDNEIGCDSCKIVWASDLSFELMQNDSTKAWFYAEEVKRLSLVVGDSYRLAESDILKGHICRFFNHLEESISYHDKALEAMLAIDNKAGIAKCYDHLGTCYMDQYEYDKSLIYKRKALAIAKQLDDKKQIAFTLNNIGVSHYMMESLDSAMYYFRISAIEKEKLNLLKSASNSYNNVGIIYQNLGVYDSAVHYYHKTIGISQKLEDDRGIASGKINLGIVLESMGDYDKALSEYLQSLELSTSTEWRKGEAINLNSIGDIYFQQERLPEAIEYHLKSLDLQHSIKSLEGEAISLNNLGKDYNYLNNLDSAQLYFNNALTIYTSINSKYGMGLSLNNLGNVASERKDYKKALNLYKKSLNIKKASGKKEEYASTLTNIGQAYYNLQQYKNAVNPTQQGLEIALEVGNKSNIKEAYLLMSMIHEKSHNYKQGLEAYKNYTVWHDSLFNIESDNRLKELNIRFETDQKENQLMLQEAQLAVKEQQNKNQSQVIWLISGILALIGGFAWHSRKQNEKLKQKNKEVEANKQEIDDLLDYTNHMVENQMRSMKGLSRIQKRNITDDIDAISVLEENEGRFEAIATVHSQLLRRRNQQNNIDLKVYFNTLTSEINNLHGKKVQIDLTVPNISIDAQRASTLGLLLNEMLTNSYKHAFSEKTNRPTIGLTISEENNNIRFHYWDNGNGKDHSQNQTSFGSKLIQAFSENLNAKLNKFNDNGSHYELVFTR